MHPSGINSDTNSIIGGQYGAGGGPDWNYHMNNTGMIPEMMDSEVSSIKSDSKNKLLLNFGKGKKELFVSVRPDQA